ncbi:MAG: hypothetical protein JSV85_02820 [Candidatus Bathyarchaeota archaeon]|nr:MAG: hypothetical protein JSV85_02820 [Candidatus Bathyarchaeota archaeon]
MEVCPTSIKKPDQVTPFYFCINVGDYTGISAASYEDFLRSIKKVKVKSLSFHVNRGDFQKWVLDILKDKKLAGNIEKMRKQKLRGQALRNRFHSIVSERLEELNNETH